MMFGEALVELLLAFKHKIAHNCYSTSEQILILTKYCCNVALSGTIKIQ